jgi:hypothetical protein
MRSESPAEVVNNQNLDIGFRLSQIHQRVPSSLGRERERERDGSWSIVAMAKSVWSTSFLLLLLASTLLLQQSLTLVTGNRFPPTLSSRAAAALEHFFFLFLLSEKCMVHSSCFEVVLSCVRCASGWICWPLKSMTGFWSQSSLFSVCLLLLLCGPHFTILRHAPRKPSFDLSVHLQGGVLYVIHLVL